MIERVYIKNLLSFKEVELNFKDSLILFTGPSGAGKSVLIKGILSIFGVFESEGEVLEAIVNRKINLENIGIVGDELIFKRVKKNKVRFFINNQAVSKKLVKEISKDIISYLGVKDEITSKEILRVLDLIGKSEIKEFKKEFFELKQLKNRLKEVKKREKIAKERIEFIKFELDRFYKLSPKEGEFEELLEIKKKISKIEKITQSALKAEEIFEFEGAVYQFLREVNKNEDFFSNAMNELRVIIEEEKSKIEELKEIDIEEVLNRLSELDSLIKRFGSIKEAIRYFKKKEEELRELENLSFTKENLKKEIQKKEIELLKKAKNISQKRKEALKTLNAKMNYFLKKLHLNEAKITLSKKELSEDGVDEVKFNLNNTDLKNLSTGEMNRLKMAFLASWIENGDKRSLFLDEIDANLSGDELKSVAEVLKILSKKYQIFAISHHPQLVAVANQHFLVTKENEISKIKELDEDEKIKEIARIIGVSKEKAKEYLKELIKD